MHSHGLGFCCALSFHSNDVASTLYSHWQHSKDGQVKGCRRRAKGSGQHASDKECSTHCSAPAGAAAPWCLSIRCSLTFSFRVVLANRVSLVGDGVRNHRNLTRNQSRGYRCSKQGSGRLGIFSIFPRGIFFRSSAHHQPPIPIPFSPYILISLLSIALSWSKGARLELRYISVSISVPSQCSASQPGRALRR